MKIVIKGRPYSKKNSRRHVPRVNKRTGKHYAMSLPSENFESFENNALYQLKKIHESFKGLLKVDYEFYQKGKMFQDVDNAMSSINDVLQKAKIIDNDRNIQCGSFIVIPESPDWKSIITLTPLDS